MNDKQTVVFLLPPQTVFDVLSKAIIQVATLGAPKIEGGSDSLMVVRQLIRTLVAKNTIKIIDEHIAEESDSTAGAGKGTPDPENLASLERSQLSATVSLDSSIFTAKFDDDDALDQNIPSQVRQLILSTITILRIYRALAAKHFNPLHRTFVNKATAEIRHFAEDPSSALIPHSLVETIPSLLKGLRTMEASAPADYLLIASILALGTEATRINDIFFSSLIKSLREDHLVSFGHRIDVPYEISHPSCRQQILRIFTDRLLYRYPSLEPSPKSENVSYAINRLFQLSQVKAASPNELYVSVSPGLDKPLLPSVSYLSSTDAMTTLLHIAMLSWCGPYGVTELASLLLRGAPGCYNPLDIHSKPLRDPAILKVLSAGVYLAASWAFTAEIPRLNDAHNLIQRLWQCTSLEEGGENRSEVDTEEQPTHLSDISAINGIDISNAHISKRCSQDVRSVSVRKLTYNGRIMQVSIQRYSEHEAAPSPSTIICSSKAESMQATDEGQAFLLEPADDVLHLVAKCCIAQYITLPYEIPETSATAIPTDGSIRGGGGSTESEKPLEILSASSGEDDDDHTGRAVDTPRNNLSSSKSIDMFFGVDSPTSVIPNTNTNSTAAPIDTSLVSVVEGPLTAEQYERHQEMTRLTATIFAEMAVRLYRFKHKFQTSHPLMDFTRMRQVSETEIFVEYIDTEYIPSLGGTHFDVNQLGMSGEEELLLQLARTPSVGTSQQEPIISGGQYNDRGVRMTTAEVMWIEKQKRLETRQQLKREMFKLLNGSDTSHSPPPTSLEDTLIVAQNNESDDLFAPIPTDPNTNPLIGGGPNIDISNRSTNTIAPPSVSGYPEEVGKVLPPNAERRPTLNGSESNIPFVVVGKLRTSVDSTLVSESSVAVGLASRPPVLAIPISINNALHNAGSSSNHNHLHRHSATDDEKIISLNTSQIIARSTNSSPFGVGARRLKINQRTPVADFLESTQRSQTSALPITASEIEVLESFPDTEIDLHRLLTCLSRSHSTKVSQLSHMLNSTLAPNTLILTGSNAPSPTAPTRIVSRPVSPSATQTQSIELAANSVISMSCESPLRRDLRLGDMSPINKTIRSSIEGTLSAAFGQTSLPAVVLREKLLFVIIAWVVARLSAAWHRSSPHQTSKKSAFFLIISELLSLLQGANHADETEFELSTVILEAFLRIATGPTIKGAAGPVTSSAIPSAGPVLGIPPEMIPVEVKGRLAVPRNRYIHLTPYLWPQEQLQGTFQRLSALIHSTMQQIVEIPQEWSSVSTSTYISVVGSCNDEKILESIKAHCSERETEVAATLISLSSSTLGNPFGQPLRDWAFRRGLPQGTGALHDRVAARDKWQNDTGMSLIHSLRKTVQISAAEKLLQWLEFVVLLLVTPKATAGVAAPLPKSASMANDVIQYCGQAACILRTAEAEEGPPMAVTQFFGRRLSESAHLQVQNAKHKYIPIHLHDAQFLKESVADLRHSFQELQSVAHATFGNPDVLLEMVGQTIAQLQNVQAGIYNESISVAMEALSLPGTLMDWLGTNGDINSPAVATDSANESKISLQSYLLDAWKCQTLNNKSLSKISAPMHSNASLEARAKMFELTIKRPLRKGGIWYSTALEEELEQCRRVQAINDTPEARAIRLQKLMIAKILRAPETDVATKAALTNFDILQNDKSIENIPSMLKLLAVATQSSAPHLSSLSTISTLNGSVTSQNPNHRSTLNQTVTTTTNGPFRHAVSNTALSSFAAAHQRGAPHMDNTPTSIASPLVLPTDVQIELKKKVSTLRSTWAVQIGSLRRRLNRCVVDLQSSGLLPTVDGQGRQIVVDMDGTELLEATLQLLSSVTSL